MDKYFITIQKTETYPRACRPPSEASERTSRRIRREPQPGNRRKAQMFKTARQLNGHFNSNITIMSPYEPALL